MHNAFSLSSYLPIAFLSHKYVHNIGMQIFGSFGMSNMIFLIYHISYHYHIY